MENVSRDSSGPHNAYGALRLSMLVPHMWVKTPSLWYEVLLSGEGDMPAQRSETISPNPLSESPSVSMAPVPVCWCHQEWEMPNSSSSDTVWRFWRSQTWRSLCWVEDWETPGPGHPLTVGGGLVDTGSGLPSATQKVEVRRHWVSVFFSSPRVTSQSDIFLLPFRVFFWLSTILFSEILVVLSERSKERWLYAILSQIHDYLFL